MKKGTYQSAQALKSYWNSQNQKLQLLEQHVAQGGSFSGELAQMMAQMQDSGMTAYEQMMKTQQMLQRYLAENADAAPAVPEKPAENPWANPVIDAIDLEDPKTIKRREVQLTLCEDTPRGESALPESGILLMLGDEDSYAGALKAHLTARGLQIRHIRSFLTEDEAEAQVAEAAREGLITGLVVLGNKYYAEADRDRYYDYIMTIACLIKRFVIYTREQKVQRQWLFLFNTFLDGRLGMTGQSEYYYYGTLNGMAKCIEIELRGNVYVKEIDFEPGMTNEAMLECLEDELRCHEFLQEVGRTPDGKRHCLTSVLTRSVVTENRFPLEENEVLLVSGGGRGVTSSCIWELAKRARCTFVLLGRSPIVEENMDDAETAQVKELKDMKNLFSRRFKAQGKKISFADIDRKARAVLSQRETLGTMEKIRATGNQVFYYACDVNDRESMAKTIAVIHQNVGKITGVVHGAGIVSDSKIWNKEMKSFQRVFDTKYKGLNNIMDHVDKESLKLLVMFSSLSGYFGNDGQIDYVSANEYMDKFAYYMRAHYPNCLATAINWGAWRGGMMYTDSLYIDTLQERGYILIPLEVGANYFANDFLMGLPSAQILINNTGNPPV